MHSGPARARARERGWYRGTNEFRDRTRGRSCLGLIEQRWRTSFSVRRIPIERRREKEKLDKNQV